MTTATEARHPLHSNLSKHSERELLVKLLAEARVQTLIMAEAFNFTGDVAELRDEVMSQGNATLSDV